MLAKESTLLQKARNGMPHMGKPLYYYVPVFVTVVWMGVRVSIRVWVSVSVSQWDSNQTMYGQSGHICGTGQTK